MFRVEFTAAAARQARKLPPEHRARVQQALHTLASEPRPANATFPAWSSSRRITTDEDIEYSTLRNLLWRARKLAM